MPYYSNVNTTMASGIKRTVTSTRNWYGIMKTTAGTARSNEIRFSALPYPLELAFVVVI